MGYAGVSESDEDPLQPTLATKKRRIDTCLSNQSGSSAPNKSERCCGNKCIQSFSQEDRQKIQFVFSSKNRVEQKRFNGLLPTFFTPQPGKVNRREGKNVANKPS